jgi:hypothetical protein
MEVLAAMDWLIAAGWPVGLAGSLWLAQAVTSIDGDKAERATGWLAYDVGI